MILETASIGLIIPFVQILIEEDLSPKLIEVFNFLNIYPSSKAQFVIVLLSSIGILFTSKVLFLTYFSYAQVKLIADLRVSLSDKLYKKYIYQNIQSNG